jgi:A/G-specific adenine glycosylase
MSLGDEHYLIEQARKFSNKTLEYHFDNDDSKAIRATLKDWYYQNRRRLPWRGDSYGDKNAVINPTPYSVWVSEVMLQQTRVETVIPYFIKWMSKYPTIESLAKGSPDEINAMWAGLGYYRRGQLLLKGAKEVMQNYDGIVPNTIPKLLKIPGIGKYTAGAIASIAYHQDEAIVDGNVIRILSRLRAINNRENDNSHEILSDKHNGEPIQSSRGFNNHVLSATDLEKLYWQLSESLIKNETDPSSFNQGLMDLGSMICKPKSPSCEICPLQSYCYSYHFVRLKQTIGQSKRNDSGTDTDKILSLTTSGSYTDIEDIIQSLPASVTYFPTKPEKKPPKEVHLCVCVFYHYDHNHSSSTRIMHDTIMKKRRNNIRGKEMKSPSKGSDIRKFFQMSKSNNNNSEVDDRDEELNSEHEKNPIKRFLFVRRPSSGLLANQWEFPSMTINLAMDCNDTNTLPVSTTLNGSKVNAKRVSKRKLKDSVENLRLKSRSITSNLNGVKKDVIVIDCDDDPSYPLDSSHFTPSRSQRLKRSRDETFDENRSHSTAANIEPLWSSPAIEFAQHMLKRYGIMLSDQTNGRLLMEANNTGRWSERHVYWSNEHNSGLNLAQLLRVVDQEQMKWRHDRDDPITHIFSHEKHIMQIHEIEVEYTQFENDEACYLESKWMTADEIMEAGITSECLKILQTIH